jgi:hypothetical protein
MDYLLDILGQEFAYMQAQLQELSSDHEQYRRFMQDEFPSLLLDGFRKAGITRAKSRIQRIAAILSNSMKSSTLPPPDEVEEFACSLSGPICRSMFWNQTVRRVIREPIWIGWRSTELAVPGFGVSGSGIAAP